MTDTAIARLDSRAAIAVGGEDWRSFLQGLLTQDVETLQDGELRFGGLLTPQGRLMHDVFILGRPDGCLLDVAREGREDLVQRLTMYRLRAKVGVELFDEASVWAAWPSPGGAHWPADPRLPALGARGYRVTQAEAATTTEAEYERHRLALGVPATADWAGGTTYPMEAGFDLLNGIDFRKGCFVGQETTSRMKRRGQIKSRMLPIAFDGPPPAPGTEILAGELRAGEVLSGIEGRAMALVRLDRALGAELTADGRPMRVERPGWLVEAGDNAA